MGPDAEPITWLRDGPHRQFEHSLMICEVLASIEIAIRERRDLRFIAWPEILAKAPENTRRSAKPYLLIAGEGLSIAPDALFGIAYLRDGRKTYRFFALEADRGTMPLVREDGNKTSYLGKVGTYREIIGRQRHKTCLGIPNLLVLTVTTSEGRMANIIERLDASSDDNAAFLFKTMYPGVPRAPVGQFVLEPWQRAMPPMLDIAAPS